MLSVIKTQNANTIWRLARFAVISSYLLLVACGTVPPKSTPDLATLAIRAESLYDQANYPAAAEIWQSLAQSDAGKASSWQLRAADAWLRHQQPNIAARELSTLNQATLSPQQLAHWQLLRTELVLLQGDPATASLLFERLKQQLDDLPNWLNDRVMRLNGQLGDPRLVAANNALSQLINPSPGGTKLAAFNELANLPGGLLSELQAIANPAQRTQLQAINLARNNAISQHFNLADTTAQTPVIDHAAIQAEIARTSESQQQQIKQFSEQLYRPATIAVLLPSSGPLKTAANAIHQGIISSWLSLPENRRPRLVFIDSGDSNRDARGAYFSAVDNAADWIIGPLRKESVAALIDLPNRNLPLLALNQPERTLDALGSSLPQQELATHYIFALPPEDDARATAKLAFQQGHKSIIILQPSSSSGLRLAEAFANELNHHNGQVLQTSVYEQDAIEYTELLSGALRLDASQQRHARLQRLLGLEELGFRQQGRSDVDALFIAGNSAQARLLLPQLKFLDLDYLPVYATRRVYQGTPNPRRDRDLNGLFFTQQAWLANQPPAPSVDTMQQWFPENRNALLAELFGLGRDSLLLLPYLTMLEGDQQISLQAASGQLQINDDGYVTRSLQAMQFRNGRPVLLRQQNRAR